MHATTTVRAAATAILGALAVTVPATAAQAAPPSNGCPRGYTSYTVEYLESVGPYQVPRTMDEQFGSFGRSPNHNGSVCAVPLGNKTFDGFQIYNFVDDSLPASSTS